MFIWVLLFPFACCVLMALSVPVQELKSVGSDPLEIDLFVGLYSGFSFGSRKSPCLLSLTSHIRPFSVSLIVIRCGVMLLVFLGLVTFAFSHL